MQALRRRLAGLSAARFDPELVSLHVPSLGPVRRRRQCVKHLPPDIEKTQGDRTAMASVTGPNQRSIPPLSEL